MDYFTSQRQRLSLGPELHRGGEGAIYPVLGQASLAAKLYVPAPRPGYEDKLAWMRANPPADPSQVLGHASIAWPVNLLYDTRGQFAGYVMPYISGTAPLLEVFNPRRRAQTLPGFNWYYLHRTGRNLAAALGALHAKGYVVGDLNESNVLVTPAALVSLIDCDSFQVRERRDAQIIFYPCPVGKPEYTPPELQGQSFGDLVRLPEHDRFGLGVLIFQLLMEGSHPFRCQWRGPGDPPPVEEKISKGWFPYAPPVSGPIAPPPNAPTLDLLHPKIAGLIKRCFADGHHNPRLRPSAEEWEQALIEAEHALARCRNGHYYSGHLTQCPQCGAGRVTVQAPLPPVARQTRGQNQGGSGTAAVLLTPQPATAMPRPATPAVATQPTTVACPQCGSSSPANVSYCHSCGRLLAPATLACPRCGRANAAAEIYCQGCAEPLSGVRSGMRCGHTVPQNVRYCPTCGAKV